MKKYSIDDLRDIMVQLRGENGCPWDKVQTCLLYTSDAADE